MSAIKRFFEKRKLNIKFKKAGGGHRLDEPQSARQSSGAGGASGERQAPRSKPADPQAAQKAADAALARLENKSKDSTVVVRARMRTEIEAEKRKIYEGESAAAQAVPAGPREVTLDGAPMMQQVLYCCPEIGPEVLPKEEMYTHIQTFLYGSLGEDPEMTSAIMIHTLNRNPEKVKVCVETLLKYLDNILNNPQEEKFRKIRVGNKAFQERVSCLEGTEEFLQAAGFTLRSLPLDDHQESFWIMEEGLATDTERLSNIKDVLLAAEPIRPQLDRGLRLFHPSQRASTFQIPDEFYNVSQAELKKEQARREEAVEKLGMLRTKAMRERDELKELRRYRFALVRVRLPDGVLLQGVFKATEKLAALRHFVGELLVHWLPFTLTNATGQRLVEDNATMAELALAPAAVVNFMWDAEVQADIARQKGAAHRDEPILKPEVMALIQSL